MAPISRKRPHFSLLIVSCLLGTQVIQAQNLLASIQEDPLSLLEAIGNNVSQSTTAPQQSNATDTVGVWEIYSLFFTLDGPSGNGLLKEGSQIAEFTGFMANITQRFPPDLATEEEILEVTTKCYYAGQQSFDEDLLLAASPQQRADFYAKLKRRSIFRQNGDKEDKYETLLKANTTYQYNYIMNYSSPSVNVSQYPRFYEATMRNSKLSVALKLRQILSVPLTNVLIVQDIFRGPTTSEVPGQSLFNSLPGMEGNGTIINLNITQGNQTTSINITQYQTEQPSPPPTPVPTTSDAPTITATPTKPPSIPPSLNPSTWPSEAPSLYPTFFTNSSSRGRFELTFIVVGPRNPHTMFINKTVFCEIMQSYTPVVAPPEHNPEHVYTTCPSIDGAFTTTPAKVATAVPAASPLMEGEEPIYTNDDGFGFGLEDEDGDGDLDVPVPPAIAPPPSAAPTSFGWEEANLTMPISPQGEEQGLVPPPDEQGPFTRALFLRGSSIHNEWDWDADEEREEEDAMDSTDWMWEEESNQRSLQLITNGTPGVPPTYPSYTWRYTIILRYTSAYWNVSDYPLYLEAYIQDNKDELEDELVEKYNLTNSNSTLTVVGFQLFIDLTNAPSDAPSSFPSVKPSVRTTDQPTYSPTNLTLPPVFPTEAPTIQLPTQKPTSKPSSNEGKMIISVVVIVIFLSSVLMVLLILLYQKRREKLSVYEYERRSNRPPSEGPETVIIPPTNMRDTSGNDRHMKLSTTATKSPSQLSMVMDLSSPSQRQTTSERTTSERTGEGPPSHNSTRSHTSSKSPKPPHHSKELSNGSASLASTVSAASSSQDSQGAGHLTTINGTTTTNPTTPEQQKKALLHPPRSILSDIEEDPYSTDDLADDEFSDSQFASSRKSPAASSVPPLDPFAQYNDQNLERMRSGVQGNVSGLDGMMSQAMTDALIGGAANSPREMTPPWQGASSGVQVEANTLWQVTEWMKRNPRAREDKKQAYMQELLTQMVTSVRKGFVDPEDASRTIHECAHLLGLQLANQLPVETILLTGMQKTTTANDVINTMRVFGAVEDAAVASGERGFGFVRFKTQKSIGDAMYRYRMSEVVVKNVAITLRPLSSHDVDL